MPDLPAELPEILDHLRRYPAVERVILFGSQARGEARATSDIDVALIAPTLSTADWTDLLHWAEADAPTLRKLDLSHFDELAPDLQTLILREGLTLHER